MKLYELEQVTNPHYSNLKRWTWVEVYEGVRIRFLELTHGHYTNFLDEDWEIVKPHWWHAARHHQTWYTLANIRKPDGSPTTIKMHTLIMGPPPPGKVWDHINRNGLNNLPENLRPATRAENQHNRGVTKNSKTGVKGVQVTPAGTYRAVIHSNGETWSRNFDTLGEAEAWQQDMARKLHGEFAYEAAA